MIQVSVKKNDIETNGATFEDQATADAWIAQCVVNGSWGEPETYVVTSIDITTLRALQDAVDADIRLQPIGAKVIAYIMNVNRLKLQEGSVQIADIIASVQDPSLSTIRELLWAGSIPMAKLMLSQLSTPYGIYTADDMSALLAFINSLGF